MDWKIALEVTGLVITLGGALIFTLRRMDGRFAQMQEIQTKGFAEVQRGQTEAFHQLDVRMARIETTVGPYSNDINDLKQKVSRQEINSAENRGVLKSLQEDMERVTRQLEALQQRRA